MIKSLQISAQQWWNSWSFWNGKEEVKESNSACEEFSEHSYLSDQNIFLILMAKITDVPSYIFQS